jgi:SAM-dependent methyltransferase
MPAGSAVSRVLGLLDHEPVSTERLDGWLDLGSDPPGGAPARIQRVWASRLGARLYALPRPGLLEAYRRGRDLLRLEPGDTVLDVGCGPGTFTAWLAARVAPDGLALGLDVSVAMLDIAARGSAAPNLVFGRCGGAGLPLRDATVDAVACMATLQLLPDPMAELDEIARVTRPGGRVVVLTTCRGSHPRARRVLGRATGVRMFGRTDIPDALRARGFGDVHERARGLFQLTSARKTAS